jgi:hypothetical protein
MFYLHSNRQLLAWLHKIARIALVVAGATSAIIATLTMLHSTSIAQQNHSIAAPIVLAEYQAWHGLVPTHTNPPYVSTDPLVISRHIAMAQALGISGFVVDWYGPPAGLSNDTDRAFVDQATAELIRQAEMRGFKVALMYDEGTLSNTVPLTTLRQTRAISDLLYARRYFTSPAYLNISGHPALFVFPYPQVDPDIDWSQARSQLGITLTLLDEDPNPDDQPHDVQFDGFYAWVQPPSSGWREDGTEWGHDYLTWFYGVMAGLAPTYTTRVAVGGVWPGFDDSQAPWGIPPYRYMWRRCGQTWRDTWQLADQFTPPYVMIATWNDFEEGSDIEFGIGDCLIQAQQRSALPGHTIVYTHVLTNTGKFTDTFTVIGSSSYNWPLAITPNSTLLLGHTGVTVTLTVTVPLTMTGSIQDSLTITATSSLSPSVYHRLINTAAVLWGIHLPIIRRN